MPKTIEQYALSILGAMAVEEAPHAGMLIVAEAGRAKATTLTCPRCEGDGLDVTGAPDDDERGAPLCDVCGGQRRVTWRQLAKHYR